MAKAPRARLGTPPVLLALLLAQACGEAPAGSPEVITSRNVSYRRDVQPLFDARCTSGACHGGRSNERIDLTPGASHATLVGGRSQLDASLRLVAPGDPGASLLWLKLTGTPPVGKRMPPKGKPLEADAVAVIEAWILAGAPDN